jgi:hypothetical protein
MPKMLGKALFISKQTVKWHKVSGYMTLLINLGTT